MPVARPCLWSVINEGEERVKVRPDLLLPRREVLTRVLRSQRGAARTADCLGDMRPHWEPALQDLTLRSNSLVTVANWIYIWGHWPVIIAVGAWLWLRRPSTYYLVRNAFLISGAIGLVIFATFPVAPPRLTDLSVVDTVTLHSNAYRVLQPPAFVNQYASVPSLHFGWDLLIGLALIHTASSRPLLQALDAQAVSIHQRLLSPELVRALRRRTALLMTWPVNSVPRMDELLSWGVTGIISDDPRVLRELVRRRARPLNPGPPAADVEHCSI
jgi:PAP2 superfamily/Glycerophosphoryl diester phosphodiesterase family